jgi:hypothetical protein
MIFNLKIVITQTNKTNQQTQTETERKYIESSQRIQNLALGVIYIFIPYFNNNTIIKEEFKIVTIHKIHSFYALRSINENASGFL